MLRRLLIAAVLLAGIGAFAAPRAHAANITCPNPEPQVLTSQHFYLTYQDDATSPDYVSQSQAQGVLATAEQAYDKFVAQGYTPWPANWAWVVNGRVELDILNLASLNVSAYWCAGAFDFDSTTVGKPSGDETIYGSVFKQFMMADGVWDYWLDQGIGEWAALKALGYPADATTDLGPWDISLDCVPSFNASTNLENGTCSKTGYENDRLSSWPFYEYLAERFGAPSFINELMSDVNTAGDGLTGLQNALTAHGTSLVNEYGSFTSKLLTGGWTATALNTVAPTVSGTILTGAANGDTSSQSFRIGHLATRFVQIDRGDGSAAHKCYTANLTINVTVSPAAPTQPVFYWATGGSAPVPLTVSGSTATATVPWDTCQWSSHGYLALQNESTTLDSAYFTVSTHLAVTTTETTATPPSVPANSYGNSTDAGSAVGAPVVSLRGPASLKLSPTDTTLDLIVEASDEGTISAKLGALNLGTKTIEPGMNAIHYAIPAGSTGTLTVTPTSSDGKTVGKAVTMTVAKDAPTTVKRNLKLKRTVKKRPKLKFSSKTAKKPKPKK